jgi:hypothetical protein
LQVIENNDLHPSALIGNVLELFTRTPVHGRKIACSRDLNGESHPPSTEGFAGAQMHGRYRSSSNTVDVARCFTENCLFLIRRVARRDMFEHIPYSAVTETSLIYWEVGSNHASAHAEKLDTRLNVRPPHVG